MGGLTRSGGNTDGTAAFTITCADAIDLAGNVAEVVTATYEVHNLVPPEVFTGGAVDAPPAVNTGNAGRTYPVRWTLAVANGDAITDVGVVSSITQSETDCDTVGGTSSEMEEADSTGGGLSVTGGGEFKFNWASPNQAGCYVLNISLADGNTLSAQFDLR